MDWALSFIIIVCFMISVGISLILGKYMKRFDQWLQNQPKEYQEKFDDISVIVIISTMAIVVALFIGKIAAL